jgi:exoribonuclease R
MSGTYISPRGAVKTDLSALAAKSAAERRDLRFAATVVGAHEFGVFVDIEELGVEGLLPASKIPSSGLDGSIVNTFK